MVQLGLNKTEIIIYAGAQIQDFPKGADHGERGARTYNGGLGLDPPAGSRVRAPGGSGGALPP